jgi:DNA-binding IclR family transcriptional regulator
LCRATLERLHASTRESVFLSIIVGGNRVNVDWIEGQGRRVSVGQRGRSVPPHCTKVSRMLLSYLPDSEIEAYLANGAPLNQFDDTFPDMGVTTAESLWHDIRTMRGAEYVTWRSPQKYGAAYLAFPIPGADGRLHGIVTIGGPMERFDPEATVKQSAIRSAVAQLQQQCVAFTSAPIVISGRTLPIISSARRTMSILETIGRADGPMGVTDIARRLDLQPGTVFRGLNALEQAGYISRFQSSSGEEGRPMPRRKRRGRSAQVGKEELSIRRLVCRSRSSETIGCAEG